MTDSRVPFVDLAAQHAELADEAAARFEAVFRAGDLILGADVPGFEAEFAAYSEAAFAVGTDSGLSALELALRALGVGAGDEVITAANTFVATALAITHVGATPVLVDADPVTYTIDVGAVANAIGPRTKAIVPVHLYGHPAEMAPIMELADKHGLVVVEDACQAHGARYRGRRVGSLGHAAAFSFYPAKNLGAAGDAGMLVTSDEVVAETARALRNYGERAKYDHVVKGFNHRLDTVQAAVLRLKLPHLDGWNARRREHAARYGRLLADTGVALPTAAEDVEPVWHLYVVRSKDRDALRSFLAERGVSTGIHYPKPVHLHEAYRDLPYAEGAFPVSEAYANEVLSLPMYPELTEGLLSVVGEAMSEFGNESPRRAAAAAA